MSCFRNAESKKNSDLNFKLITNVNHNKRTSGFDASINYGPNFKDADKQIIVDGKLDRRIKSWSMAAVDFSGKMEIGTVSRLEILKTILERMYMQLKALHLKFTNCSRYSFFKSVLNLYFISGLRYILIANDL